MKKKDCKLCGATYKPKGGYSFYCKSCRILKKKEWRKKYKHGLAGMAAKKRWNRSERAREAYKRYRSKPQYKKYSKKRYHSQDENKKKAHYYIQNAIRDGKLKRPSRCEKCKRKDWGIGRTMIEAHHYLGYEPQFWLSVQWLCTDCHKEVDAR